MRGRILCALGAALVLSSVGAEDNTSLVLARTAIRGNEELPKVLTIVPWKDAALSDIDGRPANRLIDEVLSPLDREVFQRRQRYFGQLYSSGAPVERWGGKFCGPV